MATTLSFRLMEIACQPSYPLNSDIASPPGTFAVSLSCAEMARPKMASHTVAIPIVSMLLRFIRAPPYSPSGVVRVNVVARLRASGVAGVTQRLHDGRVARGRLVGLGRCVVLERGVPPSVRVLESLRVLHHESDLGLLSGHRHGVRGGWVARIHPLDLGHHGAVGN